MLTPEKLKIAQRMREDGHPWDVVANAVGLSAYTVRGALDPEWLAYRQSQVNRNRKVRAGEVPYRPPSRPGWMRAKPRSLQAAHPEQPLRVPVDVIADRDRRLALEHTSITAAVFGDPLPGRSALDKRRPHVVVDND